MYNTKNKYFVSEFSSKKKVFSSSKAMPGEVLLQHCPVCPSEKIPITHVALTISKLLQLKW